MLPTISFQISESYQQLIAARKGIDRAFPAVEQVRENYRLVRARAVQGDATSAEITDAQAALTRAEQDHMNSIHDYLSALAKLEYAMGISSQESAAINASTVRSTPPKSRDPAAAMGQVPRHKDHRESQRSAIRVRWQT